MDPHQQNQAKFQQHQPTPFDNHEPVGQPQMYQQDQPQMHQQGQPQMYQQGQPQMNPGFDNSGVTMDDSQTDQMQTPFVQPEGGAAVSKLAGNARLGFIRKVYGIFTAQLLVTAGFVVATTEWKGAPKFMAKPQMLTVLIISCIVNIITCIMLSCFRRIARSVPLNYILLLIFTLTESLIV